MKLKKSDLKNVTFFIPESDYDNLICRAYLESKYPDPDDYIGITSQINIDGLGGWPVDDLIVIVRRDTWPKVPSRCRVREKDEEGKWKYEDVDPTTLIHEIVEMAPIHVHSAMVTTAATRYEKAKHDKSGLIRRLCEVMCQPYRIDLPRDPKDSLARFITA